MERNLCVKIDDDMFKKIKIKIAEDGKSLKDYLLELITQDLTKTEVKG